MLKKSLLNVLVIGMCWSLWPALTTSTAIHSGCLFGASAEEQDLAALTRSLIQGAGNDREKSRALFRWIAEHINYDIESYRRNIHRPRTAQQVFIDRMAVCDGYAALFSEMARIAGLEVETIVGHSKRFDAEKGWIVNAEPDHAWNAVKIDGQWRLLDVTWGSGYIDEHNQFIKKYQEYYFLTPAEQFIYDHFPRDERWQMLARTITFREFENLLYARPAFFEYGLSPKSHSIGVIQTAGEVELRFYARESIVIAAQLIQAGKPLDDYLTFTQRHEAQYIVLAHPPQSGQYILRLFAKKQDAGPTLNWVADYSIEAQRGMGSRAGFPQVYGAFADQQSYLFEPLQRQLQADRDQKFKLAVPGAVHVLVNVQEQWHTLDRNGNLFEGYVSLAGGTVSVYAQFGSEERYSKLLDYMAR